MEVRMAVKGQAPLHFFFQVLALIMGYVKYICIIQEVPC